MRTTESCLFVFLILYFAAVYGQDADFISAEHRLVKDLMTNYDPDFSPSPFNTTTVRIDMTLLTLEVDEDRSELITNVYMRLNWSDARLQWDEGSHGGIKKIGIPNQKIWKPDITSYNGYGESVTEGHQPLALVKSDGQVVFSTPLALRTTCVFDLTYFPADEHKCGMEFGSWTYDGLKIDLEINPDNMFFTMVTNLPGFTLTNNTVEKNVQHYACCPEPYVDVTFWLTIARRPGFYFHFYVSPAVVMFLLMPFVFLCNPKHSIIIGVGVMITSALLILNVMKPSFADRAPTIMTYYSTIFILMCICMAVTVLLECVYNTKAQSPPHDKVYLFLINYAGRYLRVQKEDYLEPQTAEDLENKLENPSDCQAKWKALAVIVSRGLFISFMAVNIIITLSLFAY